MEHTKVIIHMYTFLDGKIDANFELPKDGEPSFNHCMNTVYQMSNANTFGWKSIKLMEVPGDPDLSEFKGSKLPVTDWVPEGLSAETWMVSVDPNGELAWQHNYFDYGQKRSQVIEVVSENVSPDYLAFLQSMRIPYIVGGKDDTSFDFAEVLNKLRKLFGITKLIVSGGATVNGSFLKQGLVDQISLIVSPYINGDQSLKGPFNTFGEFIPKKFNFYSLEALPDGGLHLFFNKNQLVIFADSI